MAQLGRSQPFRPHLAGPIVGTAAVNPVVASATVINRVPKRSFERRGVPHPHLSGPIVAPGGPVVPGETFRATATTLRPRRDWEAQRLRPHLAKPLLFVPGGPVGLSTITEQIVDFRSVERRVVPKPHTASGQIQPSGGQPFPSAIRVGLFPRGQWKVPQIHIPLPLVVFTAPVIAGQTVLLQSRQRPLVGRTVPHPHLAGYVVSPGGVVIPAATVRLVTTTKRTTQGRGGHFRVAPPNLTQPAPTSPFPPAIVKEQSLRRPYVGRTTPHPHLSPPNLQPSPFRPATFTGQSLRRVHIGRTTPHPHVTAPVITPFTTGPTPVGPGLFVYQAKPRALLGLRGVQIEVPPPVAPLPLPPPPLLFITFTAVLSDYRWKVSVSHPRWKVESTGYRWSTTPASPRWTAEVTRYA